MFASAGVAPDWLAALRRSYTPDPWRLGFSIVHREGRVVIGSAGLMGPPDPAVMVEIGYGHCTNV